MREQVRGSRLAQRRPPDASGGADGRSHELADPPGDGEVAFDASLADQVLDAGVIEAAILDVHRRLMKETT